MRPAALRRQLPARLERVRAQGPAVEAEHHHRLARQLGRDGHVARWRLLFRSIWQPVRASEARDVWARDGAQAGRRHQDLTSERRRSRHANSPGEPPPAAAEDAPHAASDAPSWLTPTFSRPQEHIIVIDEPGASVGENAFMEATYPDWEVPRLPISCCARTLARLVALGTLACRTCYAHRACRTCLKCRCNPHALAISGAGFPHKHRAEPRPVVWGRSPRRADDATRRRLARLGRWCEALARGVAQPSSTF